MKSSPMAQENTWLFGVDAPVCVRCLQPVSSHTKDTIEINNTSSSGNDTSINCSSDLVTAMPLVLLANRKTGAVTAYDSKLQNPCGEPLRSPPSTHIGASPPAFSSAALQQTPAVNMSMCLCSVPVGGLWVGWSSGHIGVYRMHSSTTSGSRRSRSLWSVSTGGGVHWTVSAYLYEHRAAVHMIVSGHGPWVFSAGHDHRVLQWHATTHQLLRDLTNLCRLKDDCKLSLTKMMCMALGCSSTTRFSQPRGHFIFFFSTERHLLYGISLGDPRSLSSAAAEIDKRDPPLQRIASSRPVVSSAAVLAGEADDDAAAVLCLGDDEGAVTFTPLTVVHEGGDCARLSGAEYLREVAGAALAADALHIGRGRVVTLAALSAETDCTTGIMSYVIAAASSRNTVTLLMVRVAPVVAGGHIADCALLSTVGTESAIVSLAPLFPPMRQRSVATALAAFADGTTAVLFHFQNGPTTRRAVDKGTPNHSFMSAHSSNGKAEQQHQQQQQQQQIQIHPRSVVRDWDDVHVWDSHALQARLLCALEAVRHATAIADAAEQTLSEQSQELRRLHASQSALLSKVEQLAEALNTKTAEVLALQERTTDRRRVQELEHRCLTAEREVVRLTAQNTNAATRLAQLEAERDDARGALQQAEGRYQAKLGELLREKRFLTETVSRFERETEGLSARSRQQSTDALRALLEQALSALDSG